MTFSNDKFELLRYGQNEALKLCTHYVNDVEKTIAQKNTIKDLGIFMSKNCSFKDHINTIVDSAKDLSLWILRTFASRLPTVQLERKSLRRHSVSHFFLRGGKIKHKIKQLAETKKNLIAFTKMIRVKIYMIRVKICSSPTKTFRIFNIFFKKNRM